MAGFRVFGDWNWGDYQHRKNPRLVTWAARKNTETSLNLLIPRLESSFPQLHLSKVQSCSKSMGRKKKCPCRTKFNSCTLEKPNSAGRWRRQNLEGMRAGFLTIGAVAQKKYMKRTLSLKWYTWLYCCKHVWFFCTSHLGGIVWLFLSNLPAVFLLIFWVPFTNEVRRIILSASST